MFPVRSSVTGVRGAKVTVALALANVLVFLFETSLPPESLDALVGTFGLLPARSTALFVHDPLDIGGWLLPVLTSAFLHGGWAHLVGNVLFLWVFGRALESRLGPAKLALLYGLSAIGAALMQVLASPFSNIPMIGASGAVAGLLGAHLLLFPKARVTVLFPVFIFPLFFEVPAFLFLGVWFLEQLFAGAWLSLSPLAAQAGGVAWWAHVGGFVAGAVVILSMALERARATSRRAAPHVPPTVLLDERGRLVRHVRF